MLKKRQSRAGLYAGAAIIAVALLLFGEILYVSGPRNFFRMASAAPHTDTVPPTLPALHGQPAILIFSRKPPATAMTASRRRTWRWRRSAGGAAGRPSRPRMQRYSTRRSSASSSVRGLEQCGGRSADPGISKPPFRRFCREWRWLCFVRRIHAAGGNLSNAWGLVCRHADRCPVQAAAPSRWNRRWCISRTAIRPRRAACRLSGPAATNGIQLSKSNPRAKGLAYSGEPG